MLTNWANNCIYGAVYPDKYTGKVVVMNYTVLVWDRYTILVLNFLGICKIFMFAELRFFTKWMIIIQEYWQGDKSKNSICL